MFIAQTYKFIIAVVFLSSLAFQGTGSSKNVCSPNTFSLVRTEVGSAQEVTKRCSNDGASQQNVACQKDNTRVSMELSALGARGDLIGHTREQTLQILQTENACAAWFQEVDPDAADVFRSLHYDLEENGTSDIYSITDKFGDVWFKYPWGARSIEYSGKDSFIQVNRNGPFFVRKSRVTSSDPMLRSASLDDWQLVRIGPYAGATPEARITIMLHELGHIIGRLPKDDNSSDGRSSRNTGEVLRHCKSEIHLIARQDSRSGKLIVNARQAGQP